jgi:hypothetical protein
VDHRDNFAFSLKRNEAKWRKKIRHSISDTGESTEVSYHHTLALSKRDIISPIIAKWVKYILLILINNFSPHNIQTTPGEHTASYRIGTWGF